MNERIRELAKQAGMSDDKFGMFFAEDKHNEDGVDLKKFAELIVRECGYYADVFSALECPVDMDPTETKPSDYIKREMGIAE